MFAWKRFLAIIYELELTSFSNKNPMYAAPLSLTEHVSPGWIYNSTLYKFSIYRTSPLATSNTKCHLHACSQFKICTHWSFSTLIKTAQCTGVRKNLIQTVCSPSVYYIYAVLSTNKNMQKSPSVDSQRTARRYIPEDDTIHITIGFISSA
jgi:hypothetical protein